MSLCRSYGPPVRVPTVVVGVYFVRGKGFPFHKRSGGTGGTKVWSDFRYGQEGLSRGGSTHSDRRLRHQRRDKRIFRDPTNTFIQGRESRGSRSSIYTSKDLVEFGPEGEIGLIIHG